MRRQAFTALVNFDLSVFAYPYLIKISAALQSSNLYAAQHSTKPPVVCPHPNVRVRGWNPAGNVGGGGTVGAFQPENGKGGGLPEGRCAAMPTHMLMQP